MILFLQQQAWFRHLSIWVTETVGTYVGAWAGDWLCYHLRIPHALMEYSEGVGDWQSYRNVRDWIREYEKSISDRRTDKEK